MTDKRGDGVCPDEKVHPVPAHRQGLIVHTYHVLHPGYVTSPTDGDQHYIGIVALLKCYRLNSIDILPGHYIITKHQAGHAYQPYHHGDRVLHYYPRPNGDYWPTNEEDMGLL